MPTPRRFLGVLLVLPVVAADATSQAPQLLKDINTVATTNPSSLPFGGLTCQRGRRSTGQFAIVGSWAYMRAQTTLVGRELFRTKGTSGSTKLVTDINPGAGHAQPDYMTAVGTRVFFAAQGAKGTELYVTDSVTNKTILIDLWPGTRSSDPRCLTEYGGACYFIATEQKSGAPRLWKSDGTQAGTAILTPKITPSSADWLVYKGALYFGADDGNKGTELWKTNGSATGTVQVADIRVGGLGSLPEHLTEMGGLLYFTANDGAKGPELWVTDGTANGTKLVSDINPGANGSSPKHTVAVGNMLYFQAKVGNETELYSSDGKTATKIDVKSGATSSNPWLLTAVGPDLYFAADATDPSSKFAVGYELCKWDGKKLTVFDINAGRSGSGPNDIGVVGKTVFVSASGELYKVDPSTTKGFALVKDINPHFGSEPRYLTDLNGVALFQADDFTHGVELWRSDGTTNGTVLVDDIAKPVKTASSNPSLLVRSGTKVFFTADDGVNGQEVWVTDGTTSGTKLLVDANPGASGSSPSGLTVIGSNLYFSAAGRDPKSKNLVGRELWIVDIQTGTPRVIDINVGAFNSSPHSFVAYKGEVFFVANGNLNQPNQVITGGEIWRTDGTTRGTRNVADIRPQFAGSSPSDLTVFKGMLYFSADDGKTGRELWRTDGTKNGTVQFLDTAPGQSDGKVNYVTAAANKLFFSAYGRLSTTSPVIGQELWVSDGTKQGTATIDIEPGASGSYPCPCRTRSFTPFASLNGRVFFRAGTAAEGQELYVSDGTAAGTIALVVQPGQRSGMPTVGVEPTGSRVFFIGDDGSTGRELWVTDGTKKGTTRVADIVTGLGWGVSGEVSSVGSRHVFFSGQNKNGIELWRSDGSQAGTYEVADLNTGSGNSSPAFITVLDNKILFVADDGFSGRELWVANAPANAVSAEHGCSTAALPRLQATDPVLGQSMSIMIKDAAKGTRGILALGARATPVRFLGGECQTILDLTRPMILLPFQPSSAGSFGFKQSVPSDNRLIGTVIPLQAVLGPTSQAPFGLDWTNGVYLTPDAK